MKSSVLKFLAYCIFQLLDFSSGERTFMRGDEISGLP